MDESQLNHSPATEAGTVIGNTYDKYGTRNPIARRLMDGFLAKFDLLLEASGAEGVHEVGCGEGHLSIRMAEAGLTVRASDFSKQIISQAEKNASEVGAHVAFKPASIYDLDPEEDAAELVVCCEVLEHLEEPERALSVLASLARPFVLVSVPREPLWRVLNVARGKYLRDWGNTPGHLQHWSKRQILNLLETRFDIIEESSPFPWTMVLCRVRNQDA